MAVNELMMRRRQLLSSPPTHLATASGRLIRLNDAARAPLQSCNVTLNYTQSGSGTPSLSNVRPLTGRTAVSVKQSKKNYMQNLSASQTINGVTFTANADGTITANGQASKVTEYMVNDYFTLPVGTYKFFCAPAGASAQTFHAYYFDSKWKQYGDDWGSGVSFTVSDPTKLWRFCITIEGGYNAENLIFVPVLTDDEGNDTILTSTVNLQREVYGGSVDIVTGVLTATKNGINPADCNLRYDSHDSTNYCVWIKLGEDGLPRSVKTEHPDYSAASNRFAKTNSGAGNMAVYSTSIYLTIPRGEMSEATLAVAHDWFVNHPTVVVYTMDTPVTYNISPQVIRTARGRSIWSDATDVSLSYLAH